MRILNKIVAKKRKEVDLSKSRTPVIRLERLEYFGRSCNSYLKRATMAENSGVIAEFKRRSPSQRDINLTADLESVVSGYISAGASAVSILTDHHFFGGSLDFLCRIRSIHPEIPILRKEFIIDEYQIIESKAYGADMILLICEILSVQDVNKFTRLAKSLGMEVLLELHSSDQLDKASDKVSVIGINNRDLQTFEVDFSRSKKMYDMLPVNVMKISESGLQKPETLAMLYDYGYKGFLIGEQFMRSHDPGKACEALISEYIEMRNSKTHG